MKSFQLFIKRYPFTPHLFIFSLSFLWYWGTLPLSFVSDDYDILHLIINGEINQVGFFRIVGNLMLFADYSLFGLKPLYFHLGNNLVHCLNGVIVYLLLIELGKYLSISYKDLKTIAFITSVLFAINPYTSETVYWVACRGVLLSTTFSILAVYYYLLAVTKGKKMFTTYSLISFAIALFCYETAFVVPLLVLFLLLNKPGKSLIKSIPYFLILFTYFLLRFVFDDIRSTSGYYRLDNLFNLNLFRMAARLFIPPMNNTYLFISLFVLLVVAISFLIFKFHGPISQKKILSIGLLSMISILPGLTVGIDTHDFEGGRFIYAASCYALFAIVYLLFTLKSEKRIIAQAGIGFIIMIFTIISYEVLENWQIASKKISQVLTIQYPKHSNYIFLNVPDSYNGAYIFRNGLENALKIYNKIPLNSITLITSSDKFPAQITNPVTVIDFEKLK